MSSRVPGSDKTHIRLSGPIERDSIVNGYGLRAVIWTQGCFIHCEGCQNQETWDEEGGVLVDIEDVKQELRSLKGKPASLSVVGNHRFKPKPVSKLLNLSKKNLGGTSGRFLATLMKKLRQSKTINGSFSKPSMP